jgi:hypothetical protein
MKRITQFDDDGCGVACVAMIAGVSYRRALRAMYGDKPLIKTVTGDLRRGLHALGIECGTRLVRSTTPRHYRNLREDAVLKTRTRSDGDWHWIVWDAKRKLVIDPERKENRYVRPPITSYLLVYRK